MGFELGAAMPEKAQACVSGSVLKSRGLRALAAGCMLSAALLSSSALQAAPLPLQDKQVDMTAREQPIASFLQDFFGMLDLPVAVSGNVNGAVNGVFRGPADKVLRNVLRSFGLITYYDGSVVYVYSPSEVTTRTFPLRQGTARSVIETAGSMQLPDARNTLRVSQTGALIATGNRRFVEMVGELATGQQNQSTNSAPLGFKVYYLHYAWAHDVTAQFGGGSTVIPGVATILRSLLTAQRGSEPAPLTQFRSDSEQSLRDKGLRRRGTLGAKGANPMMPTAETVQQAWGNAPGGVDVAVMDARLLDGLRETPSSNQARVEADTRLNAVIVRDLPERLPYYDELIKSLDVEPQALEIEATIIDLKTDKLRELGINWRASGDRVSFLFGEGNANDGRLINNIPVQNVTPTGTGGFLSLVLGGRNNFIARIHALQQQDVARIVSSPQIMTLSNVEALFDRTYSFYVPVAGREEVDLFKVSAGTTLRVTPHVFREGDQVHIKLLVQIEDGQFSNATVSSLPVVERSSINTQALILAGESLLIGGMVYERASEGVTKVPFLGDIPVLGNLFKVKSDGGERTERLFLISPRLIPARRSLAANAPIGPQRPGGAVAVPPVPNVNEPIRKAESQDASAPKTGAVDSVSEPKQIENGSGQASSEYAPEDNKPRFVMPEAGNM